VWTRQAGYQGRKSRDNWSRDHDAGIEVGPWVLYGARKTRNA
jgi:hypothetical protein